MNAEEIVAAMVALNRGKLVGRTRLQKEAYLLDRLGGNFGLRFTYHHYGPYSFDLAGGCAEAAAGKRIKVEEETGRHGVRYAIFKRTKTTGRPDRLGGLDAEKARGLLKKMERVPDIVLELAATVVFLRDEWDYYGKDRIDAVEETRSRKSLKAANGRLEQAVELLSELGLYERGKAPAA